MDILTTLKNFFADDMNEIVGVFFDEEKIYLTHLTENFEQLEFSINFYDMDTLAEKISLECRLRGWKTSAVGLCIRNEDAVTYESNLNNLPDKEISAMVRSWAVAQSGIDAPFSFTRLGDELWMETIPRSQLDEICRAFEKYGLHLRALSVMPDRLIEKTQPYEQAYFIANVLHEKKYPNLLAKRSGINFKKFFKMTVASVVIILMIFSVKILWNWHTVSLKLEEARESLENFHDEVIEKETIDTDIKELNRLNNLIASQNITSKKFDLLLNMGQINVEGIYLTKIYCDGNTLELSGVADNSDKVKNYLNRTKNLVISNVRLSNSAAREDGQIRFTLHAIIDK